MWQLDPLWKKTVGTEATFSTAEGERRLPMCLPESLSPKFCKNGRQSIGFYLALAQSFVCSSEIKKKKKTNNKNKQTKTENKLQIWKQIEDKLKIWM